MSRFIPRVRVADPLVDKAGRAVTAFVRFWDNAARAIERNGEELANAVTALAATVESLQASIQSAQAAQQAANEAQATADAAGGGDTRTGAAQDTAVTVSGTGAWIEGPRVDLTGVSAGDLFITGSGPLQDGDVQVSGGSPVFNGLWRVVEIVGGVDTQVFLGEFTGRISREGRPATVTNLSATAVSAFSLARSSTGAVSYRIDFAAASPGQPELTSLKAYLFVRRAA